MRRTTSRRLAALAMLAVGAGQLLAPAAEAIGYPTDNGMSFNGASLNSLSLNGVGLNGLRINGANLNGLGAQGASLNGFGSQGQGVQGSNPSGRKAEAADLGALALRAVRLPDGRVLPVARE